MKAGAISALFLALVSSTPASERPRVDSAASSHHGAQGPFGWLRTAAAEMTRGVLAPAIERFAEKLRTSPPTTAVDDARQHLEAEWEWLVVPTAALGKLFFRVAQRFGKDPGQLMLEVIEPHLANLPPQAHFKALAHFKAMALQGLDAPYHWIDSRFLAAHFALCVATFSPGIPWATTMEVADFVWHQWKTNGADDVVHRAAILAADDVPHIDDDEIRDPALVSAFLQAHDIPAVFGQREFLAALVGNASGVEPILSKDPEDGCWTLVLHVVGSTPEKAVANASRLVEVAASLGVSEHVAMLPIG